MTTTNDAPTAPVPCDVCGRLDCAPECPLNRETHCECCGEHRNDCVCRIIDHPKHGVGCLTCGVDL